MNAFRYQAIEASGTPVEGMIEAEDRKSRPPDCWAGADCSPRTWKSLSANGSASGPAGAD